MAALQVVEKPLPSVPCEVGVVPHWLAIEGVQPRISENEPIERPRAKRPRVESTTQKNSRRKLESGKFMLFQVQNSWPSCCCGNGEKVSLFLFSCSTSSSLLSPISAAASED